MASALQALILSAFVVCLVKGQLSHHDTDILIKLTKSVKNKVGKTCNRQYTKTVLHYNKDTRVDVLCHDLKAGGIARKALTAWSCTKKEAYSIEKKACDLIPESNKKRANLAVKFLKGVKKFHQICQNKIQSVAHTFATWYDVEQFCLKVVKTDKTDFKGKCTGDDYEDLKDLACGGASNLVCGLLTIGMSLVAAIFKNL